METPAARESSAVTSFACARLMIEPLCAVSIAFFPTFTCASRCSTFTFSTAPTATPPLEPATENAPLSRLLAVSAASSKSPPALTAAFSATVARVTDFATSTPSAPATEAFFEAEADAIAENSRSRFIA